MATLAGDQNINRIGCSHHRPIADAKGPHGNARHIVHAVNLLDAKAFHHALGHHLAPAAATLFGGLKDAHGRAVKIPRLGQVARSAQKHGGVAIMAASVHLAVGL